MILWVTARKPNENQFRKYMEYLNNMINPVDLYRTPHMTTEFYTYNSVAGETYIKIKYIQGHKACHNNVLKIGP